MLFRSEGGVPVSNVLGSALNLDVWHHIVVIIFYDNNTSQYVVQMFVDNEVNTYCSFATELAYYDYKTFYIGSSAFRGSMSNIAVYNKLSTNMIAGHPDQTLANLPWISKHYERGKSLRQYIYSSIASSDGTYWEEMLKIATADIGMFFFDENNHLVYEHGRIYDDSMSSKHSVVQYTLDENQDIVSADQSVELQTNKIVVKVYPSLTNNAAVQNVWSADAGSSLAKIGRAHV